MPRPASSRRVALPPVGNPLLIFDGDCGFCRFWAERLRRESHDTIATATSQATGARFSEITPADYTRSVWLIETDGRLSGGAEAIFRARALAGHGAAGWCYAHLPGFGPLADFGYKLVAQNRPAFSRLNRWIWGDDATPVSFAFPSWLFLRLLGVVYLIAFVSFWTQLSGLIGPNGILPAGEFLDAVRHQIGILGYYALPTLAWLGGTGTFLHLLCGAGVVASLLLIAGLAPGPCLIFLWAGYLSLAVVGQDFMSFQWDYLLLESGLLALLLTPWRWTVWRHRGEAPPVPAHRVLRFLLFKLMFLSGVVKLASGDPTWSSLAALRFHYETQPLPTWIGWWAHQLPGWFQSFSCVVMFAIELVLPFLLFAPRRLRHIAVLGIALLQLLIALTGNYTFFNLLTLALCVLCLDDSCWPKRWTKPEAGFPPSPARPGVLRIIAALAILAVSASEVVEPFRCLRIFPEAVAPLRRLVEPLRSINGYGLFAVMTTRRNEIVIEGSRDGLEWETYEFAWKPGAPGHRPGFVEPFQPRLDWQMWFAALGNAQDNPWFIAFVTRLLEGSPQVTALLARNPFPDAPPQYIRAVLYQYHFTDPAARARTGDWWWREKTGTYLPPVSLR